MRALGFWNKRGKILFLGLDNAGKSTLLHLLKYGKIAALEPTKMPQKEEIKIADVTLAAHDLGGHTAARQVWRTYMAKIDGIVYMVDASDMARLAESKKELTALLTDDLVKSTPFAILGNKVDLKTALSEPQLKQALGIEDACTGKDNFGRTQRPLEVFMCSVVRKFGYLAAFQWISNFLQ